MKKVMMDSKEYTPIMTTWIGDQPYQLLMRTGNDKVPLLNTTLWDLCQNWLDSLEEDD